MKRIILKSSLFILFCVLFCSSLTFSQESGYTGTFKKSEPLGFIDMDTVVIEGLEISATNTWCISFHRCKNIIIKNCKFTSSDPNLRAVYFEHCENLIVKQCYFHDVNGAVWAQGCKGTIKIEYNDVKNIRGNLNGGDRWGNGLQVSSCVGDISISYNSIENIPGESSPEDNISVFASHGTPDKPIMVKGNWIRGGGPNLSGGGINLGDYGGSFQIAEDNILVNTGSCGIGMAGGHDLTLRNNKVYGKQAPWTNWGMIIMNWTPEETGPSHNILIENNDINWTSKEGEFRTAYFDDHMKNVVHNSGKANVRNPNIFKDILPEDILIRRKTEAPKTIIYKDTFKRISVKCFDYPIPIALVDIYNSSNKKVANGKLSRFRTQIDQALEPGEYNVIVTYTKTGMVETKEITIK